MQFVSLSGRYVTHKINKYDVSTNDNYPFNNRNCSIDKLILFIKSQLFCFTVKEKFSFFTNENRTYIRVEKRKLNQKDFETKYNVLSKLLSEYHLGTTFKLIVISKNIKFESKNITHYQFNKLLDWSKFLKISRTCSLQPFVLENKFNDNTNFDLNYGFKSLELMFT